MKQDYTQTTSKKNAATINSFSRQWPGITRWLCSLIIICGLWATDAGAQVAATYTFSQSNGTYAAVTGTTVFPTGWDESVSSVSIPFTFNFNGTGYTSCNVSTNGFITFGATAPSSGLYTPISSTATYAGAIAAFGYDLISNTTPSIIVQTTTGTAPNRTFVVQWTNAKRYDFGALSGDVLNFQIRLNEGGGVALNQTVAIIYGANSTTQTINTDKGQVGLRGASNADFNNRLGGNNIAWASTTTGTTNADAVNFKSTVVPASGLTFTWTPVVLTAPSCNTMLTPVNAATGVSTEPTVLTYNSAAGATSYDIYFGTASNPPLLGNTAGTSVSITGTISGTTYFWYIAPRNGGGAATGCISNQRSFTTQAGPANDECSGATALTMNAAALAGTTVNADMSLAPLLCSGSTSTFAYDVWYKFTAINTSQTVTMVSGAGLDGVVQAFSGTCGGLVSLGCVDVSAAGGTETLSMTSLTICSTYYIRVYGYGTTGTPTGTFTIKVAGTSSLTALTSAAATPNPVCNDGIAGNISLTATGGSGGTITWYTGSCGGTLVGTGSPLVIAKPITTTTYFARRETSCGNDVTTCVSTVVTVNQKSANPTSAAASSTTICNGGSSTLTLNGGGGGTGEAIKWYSGSCGGTLAGTGNNLSVSPATTTTYFGRYEDGAPCNYNSLCSSVTITVNQKSTDPTSATATPATICIGDATSLTLNGGGSGTGEVIKWYTASCGGTLAGTGNNLSVSPTTTTTYFGRYENGTPCNYNSLCSSVTVTVNQKSANPASATATPAAICNGSATSLTLNGGGGGTGEVITWYTGSCGGTLVGTGNNLSVSPTITTTYYGRYEDGVPCNYSSLCSSVTVTVNQKSTDPASATATPATICNGDATSLTLNGGGGGTGEVIKWYTGSCGGTLAGTGNNLSVSPTTTTTYFGRYEDGTPCNYNSLCSSVTVTVNPNNTITASAGANGSISPGGTTTLSCFGTGSQIYTITPATCYSIADVVVDGVSQGSVGTYTFTNVTSDHTISATFVINTYTITVTAGANGSVTPATGSVNCGDNASYTITPDACYSIADVVVDGVSQGAVGTYTFTNVTAAHTISAAFTLNGPYTITVTAGANGSITPGTGSVNCGDNATYTITANACYSIADVVVDGVSQGAVGTYTFTNVTANHTISATFVLNTYTITVTAGANGSITPATGSVNCGDNATYTITANACYSIADVVVDDVSQGAVGTYTFTNVTADHTISATFVIDTYTITVTAGANGSVTPATGSVNCGDNATYTITANACYSIADVVVDGVSQGAVGTYTFTNVTAAHTISAAFTLNGPYTITVTAGANGSITPGTGSVNCGDNAIYTITPNACCSIADVVVDGVSQGAVGTYTFTNVTADHTISATFVLNTYTITVTADANGSITPATGSVNCGDNATYTITPNACYSIADVVVDGVSQGAVGTYTFTNVTADHTISATFVLNTYTITVTAGANGSITPATGSANCGDNATYTITANACYSIADVVVDGVSQGAVGTYTFTNVTAAHTISATFVLNTYTITVTAGANGSITPVTGSVNCGDNASYTITPNACYSIADVVVDGVSQGAVGTYTFTNVTADHTISATFSLNTYTITVTAGANGSITPATGSANCGDNATYTITANACYSIADVVVDGVSQGAVGTYTFTNVTADHTISATFVLNTYTITVTAGANGSVTPATGSVNCGDNATYTITANACCSIADVVVDGVSQGAVGTYTFTNVTADHTISATFVLNTYTITVTAGANGSITPATGSINCGANATYTITPNACYAIADVIVDGVSQGAVGTYTFTNVTADHTISATFALNTYSITVTAGSNGSITPATGSVNCGDNATYTITANTCYSIADVVVDGVSQGAVGTYTFTNVTADHTISATFVLNTYTITVTAGANGSITPATGSVNCGDNATYTITPNACYSIADVVVDGVSQGAVGTYTFTNVTADHTISATFLLNTYTITVTASANGSITPATGSVNCGDNATYTITANACYSIADVIVDGVSQGAVGTYTFTNVTADHTISATFVLNTYTITVTAGSNGSITPATGSVNCGDNATYTITANTCYSIADVVVDGVSQGAVGTYTFTNVTADHTISATFVLNTYTITVTAGANGSITPATGSVNCGDNASYTITPNACYSIADVVVDGVSQGAVGTYTFTNVTADHTISATFVLNTYTITVTSGTNGSITPVTGSVNCGDNATYTITPNACYSIGDVVVDGVSQAAVGTYTFTNVTADHTISATFVLNTYTITVTAAANGSITPATGSVNCGDNATYTITANACYSIADVVVDGVSQGAVGTYTFTNITANHTISATFVLNTYSVTVTAGVNGSITPGTGSVNCGSNATYTITPIACYHVVNVIVDGSSVGAVGTYTFTNVTANHTISATFAVNASLPAPVVTGPTNVCPYIGTGDQVTYTATAAGATGFTWVIPPTNVTIISGQGTANLTVTFQNGFAAQNNKQLRVTATAACGNSPLTVYYLLTQTPSTPQPIVGNTNVCPIIGTANTYTYTIPSVIGATSYVWVAQLGTTTITHPNGPGINDTTVNVSFAAGFTSSSITVAGANSGCGSGNARSLALVKVNPSQPGLISGPTNACPYMAPNGTVATYSIAAVAGATAYTWTVPAGATGVTAQGTTTISFTFPGSFVSGTVSVTATNGCGTGTARSLAIGKLNPATPGVIDVIQTASCPARVYTYTLSAMPANATSVQWTVPAGGNITNGQGTTSITVSYAATAINGNVTAQSFNNCGSSTTRISVVKLGACGEGRPATYTKGGTTPAATTVAAETMQVNVFPNPTVSDFKLQVVTAGKQTINVRIMDAQGRSIKTFVVMPYQTINVGSDLKAGAYIMEVRQGNEVKTTKLLKF